MLLRYTLKGHCRHRIMPILLLLLIVVLFTSQIILIRFSHDIISSFVRLMIAKRILLVC